MEWVAEAIILSARRHGETSAIVEVMTKEHGRYAGLIRGGMSRRQRPVLQSGNGVTANWKARLSEHLGVLNVEMQQPRAATVMNSPVGLAALTSACALVRFLPERHAYPRLYDTFLVLLDNLEDVDVWPALFVRFEMALLDETGFGLDLSTCAASGSHLNLTHISPRSGRAVSAEAAEPYRDKLFAMPDFLSDSAAPVSASDILDGFEITGHFLAARLLHNLDQAMPEARDRMLTLLKRDF